MGCQPPVKLTRNKGQRLTVPSGAQCSWQGFRLC